MTEGNKEKASMKAEVKGVLKLRSLVGRWFKINFQPPMFGTLESDPVRVTIGQVISEPSPSIYLIEVYALDPLTLSLKPSFQMIRTMGYFIDVEVKFFDTMERAMNYEDGLNYSYEESPVESVDEVVQTLTFKNQEAEDKPEDEKETYTPVQKLIEIRRIVNSDESLNDIVAEIKSVLDPK